MIVIIPIIIGLMIACGILIYKIRKERKALNNRDISVHKIMNRQESRGKLCTQLRNITT